MNKKQKKEFDELKDFFINFCETKFGINVEVKIDTKKLHYK